MNTNKIALIGARVWTVVCVAASIMAAANPARHIGASLGQYDYNYSAAVGWALAACAPWALIWIIRGTLRR